MEQELQLLLRRNVDGYKGYSLASEYIDNDNFKHFLETYAKQRLQFAEELTAALNERSIEAPDKSSILGDLHQAFMKLKNATVGISDEDILKECARGESQAVSDYEKIIKSNVLPQHFQNMVIRHRDKIMAAERTMRELGPVLNK